MLTNPLLLVLLVSVNPTLYKPAGKHKQARWGEAAQFDSAGKLAGAMMPGFVFPAAPASRRMSTHSQIS